MLDADRAGAVYRHLRPGWSARDRAGRADEAPDVVSAAVVSCLASPAWLNAADPGAYLYRAVLEPDPIGTPRAMRRVVREHKAAMPEAFVDIEVQYEVWDAVAHLSLRQRAVTMLTYVDDLAAPDVARLLGVSEGSVDRHLDRARKRLRKVLDD